MKGYFTYDVHYRLKNGNKVVSCLVLAHDVPELKREMKKLGYVIIKYVRTAAPRTGAR